MLKEKRNEDIMMELILKLAQKENNIRGVILNGSRTFNQAKKDDFQDFDIIYLVEDVEPFISDQSWINEFGEILIMQKPDLMDGSWPKLKEKFTFLMLFNDKNRIDLTFSTKRRYLSLPKDSRSILLLDKDNNLGDFQSPSDKDYLPKKPTEKEFLDCCNEFYWVSTYVAKGICRKELLYTKYMLNLVRQELIKLLTWHAAVKTDFKVNFGMCSKYLEEHIEQDTWRKLCKTYCNNNYDENWSSLILMNDLFNDMALILSENLNYQYEKLEYSNVAHYLKTLKQL